MMAKEGLGCSKYEQLCRCRTSLGRLAGSDQHYSSPWWSSIWTNNITQAARIPHTGPSPPFTCRAQKEPRSILQRDPCSAVWGGRYREGNLCSVPGRHGHGRGFLSGSWTWVEQPARILRAIWQKEHGDLAGENFSLEMMRTAKTFRPWRIAFH